jgi:hypothetical protein
MTLQWALAVIRSLARSRRNFHRLTTSRGTHMRPDDLQTANRRHALNYVWVPSLSNTPPAIPVEPQCCQSATYSTRSHNFGKRSFFQL